MADNIVKFPEGRGNQPDPDCVMLDDQFRKMFLFGYEYTMGDGRVWSFNLWAYDQADAEARLKAIQERLTLVGQVMGMVPA